MRNLIPHFIYQQFAQGNFSGAFAAATLFVDISGFTRLTETLMQHAKAGAEVLTDALHEVFEPLVHLVYSHGGLIPRFAGDAFTAIFGTPSATQPPAVGQAASGRPLDAAAQAALQTAFAIHQFFGPTGRIIHTPYGDFTIHVKVGFAVGQVKWGIPGKAGIYDFYFRGAAIDECAYAEAQATQNEIIADHKVLPLIQAYVSSRPLADARYHQLFSCTLVAAPSAAPPTDPPADVDFLPPPTLPQGGEGTAVSSIKSRLPPQVGEREPHWGAGGVTQADLAPFAAVSMVDPARRAEFREICVVFFSFVEPADEDALQDFLAEAMLTIGDFGGNCNQIDFGDQGGLLVLLFGAPVAYENNVVRAVEYLLALQAKPLPVRWRAGITFGTVWAGLRGGVERCEYGAVGDVMNMASRMAMKAPWGDIWLHQRVIDQLPGVYRVEAIGPLPFKGKAQAQMIYRLLAKQDGSNPALAPGALVGRADELQQLQAWVQPIYAGHFAGVFYIDGEAGIGKSRLVHALRQQIGDSGPVLWVKAPVDGMLRQSLNPFRTLVRHYFRQRSEQTPAANQAQFDQVLATLCERLYRHSPGSSLAQELVRTRSFLAALAGIQWPGSLYEQVEPQLRFDNMLAAFKNFIKAEAVLQPVILELADSHWLDEDSRRLLQLLTRNLAGTPLAILCTARYGDDGAPARFPVDADVPQAQLHLGYLALAGVQQYAEQVLQGPVTAQTARLLLDKTNGNPFFVEQLVVDLRERQLFTPAMTDRGSGYDLQPLHTITVPTTLTGLLVARLDRLQSETKAVVQTAAVLGRTFEAPVLAHMVDNNIHLPTNLQTAAQEQIWSSVGTVRYLFRHALLRDVAYDMQLRAHLRQLHRQAGAALQRVYGHELAAYYPDVAFHYDQAAATAEATHWYRLAGERAASQYANEDAVRYFTRALALLDAADQETRYQILLRREQVYEVQSNRPAQQESLAELARLAHALGDRQKQAEVNLRYATYARLTSDYPAALAAAQGAVAYAQQVHKPVLLLKGYQLWGRTLWHQGNYEAARKQVAVALALARGEDLAGEEALCLYDMGVTFYYEGNYPAAQQHLAQAQTIYRRLADRRGESSTLIMFGSIARELGDYVTAQGHYEQALQLCRALGWRYGEHFLLESMGNNAFELGDYDDAQRYHERAILGYREVEDQAGQALSLAMLGLIHHIQGRPTLAQAQVVQALASQNAVGDKSGASYSLTYLGHILTSSGDLDGAQAAYQQAITLRQALGVAGQLLDSWAGLARVCLVQGQPEEALRHVDTILAWLETHGVDGVELPIQIYLTCYGILRALGGADPHLHVRAGQVLTAGYRLLQQRAAAIQDEAMRQRFLTNVPFNRDLQAIWQAQRNAEPAALAPGASPWLTPQVPHPQG